MCTRVFVCNAVGEEEVAGRAAAAAAAVRPQDKIIRLMHIYLMLIGVHG